MARAKPKLDWLEDARRVRANISRSHEEVGAKLAHRFVGRFFPDDHVVKHARIELCE